MNWHRFAWPFVLTVMIVSFVAGYPLVTAGIFVIVGGGAVALEFWQNHRA